MRVWYVVLCWANAAVALGCAAAGFVGGRPVDVAVGCVVFLPVGLYSLWLGALEAMPSGNYFIGPWVLTVWRPDRTDDDAEG